MADYGFRPGRSAQAAVARVEEQLEAGKTWVVDADIKGSYIPGSRLLMPIPATGKPSRHRPSRQAISSLSPSHIESICVRHPARRCVFLEPLV
jgi:hypothetical protein